MISMTNAARDNADRPKPVRPAPRAVAQPQTVWLNCIREPRLGEASTRTAQLGVQFGIPLFAEPTVLVGPVRITLGPGRVVLLCGPSGSGKTSALEQLRTKCPEACSLNDIQFPHHAAVIDGVAPAAELGDAIRTLTACGLGDANLWPRRFDELSEGEKFRARLARGVAMQAAEPPPSAEAAPSVLLCDEFCSLLDRRAARALAHALRKLVTRQRLCVVAASTNADLITDLQPDTVLSLQGQGRWRCQEQPPPVPRPVTFLRRLHVQPGTKADYDEFAAMHYRAAEELGFVDKVFVLRDEADGELLGIVVYAHSPLELSLRNQATGGAFCRHPRRVNRRLRILRRLVIRPDVRGCGLGQYLVRRTLPRVGTEFVECLAAMGEFNPVFEKAGMRRIGRCPVSPEQHAAIDALRALDADVSSREFPIRVCRDRRVRQIVLEAVDHWYAATTGGGRRRVDRQPPHVLAQTFRGLAGLRPVYYLWQRPGSR